MADYGGLPDFSSYLSNQGALDKISAGGGAPAAPAPVNTGTGNFLTAALGSGYHSALAQVGGFGEALSKVAGYDQGAQASSDFADSQRAQAAGYARPDLEEGSWTDPTTLAYKVAQMAPGAAIAAGGSIAAALAAPEEAVAAGMTGLAGIAARHAAMLGGAAALFPTAVGSNVETQKDYAGELSKGQALKSLLYGVPEAALQGVLPGKLEGLIGSAPGQGFLKTVKNAALTQLPIGAANEFLTEQMGDPNRPLGDRAQSIVTAALQGAALGGLTAGAVHPISSLLHSFAKTPPPNVDNDQLTEATKAADTPVAPLQLQAPHYFPGERLQRGLTPEQLEEQRVDNNQVQSGQTVELPDQSGGEPIEPTLTPQLQAPHNFPGDRASLTLSPEERAQQANRVPSGGVVHAGPPSEWRGMADATAQPPLTLEQAKGLAPANENLPPPVRSAEALPDVASTNPASPEFPAAGGVNSNVEGPGATREATAQPGLETKAPEAVKPANDIFDQKPLQADLNKLPDLRGKDFKTETEAADAVAATLKAKLDADKVPAPALTRLAETLGVTDKDGNLIGRHAADAQPTEGPEGPHETLEAGPQEPKAPARADIPTKTGQASFDRLQALRDQMGNNLDPPTLALKSRINDLQNELQDVKGSSRHSEIKGEITGLEGEVAKHTAPPEPPPSEPTALASSTAPTPDAAQFISERQGQPSTAEARAKARRAGTPVDEPPTVAKSLPENIPAVNPQDVAEDAAAQERMAGEGGPAPNETDTPALTQEAARRAARDSAAAAAPKSLDPDAPVTPERADIKRAQVGADGVENAEAMKRQKRESQTTQAVEAVAKDPTPKTPLTPQITDALAQARSALDALKANPPAGVNAARVNFNKNIAAHEKQLAFLEKAASEGGLEALQNVRRDHFDDNLWTDALGKLSPEGETALNNHAEAEAHLMEQITGLRGERPLIRYETQPTVHDVNQRNVIESTGKLSDALEYVRQKDPSPMNRMMASILSRLGLDSSIRMASDEHLLEDVTRKLGEGEIIAGSYNAGLNRVSIYDGSNISRSVLHEAFHAATVRALASGSRAASEMRGLFDRLKASAGDFKAYGFTNAEEMVAEAGSNPTFQQFLKSEPVSTGSRIGDMWQSFKNAMFKTLGMPERVRTAFDQVMDGTQKLMAENPTQAAITGERAMIAERGVKALGDLQDMLGAEGRAALIRDASDTKSKLTGKVRDGVLGWVGTLDIGEVWKDTAPAILKYGHTVESVAPRKDVLAKSGAAALHEVSGLKGKLLDNFNALAAHSVEGLDGTRPWSEIKEYFKDRPAAEQVRLKAQHALAEQAANVLRGGGGKAMETYQKAVAENASKNSLQHIHFMQNYVERAAPEVKLMKGFTTDAFDDYGKASAVHDDPREANKMLKAREAEQRQSLKAVHSDLLKNRDDLLAKAKADDKLPRDQQMPREVRNTLDEDIKLAKAKYTDLNDLLTGIDRSTKLNEQRPYFSAGRTGEHFVNAHLAADENGVVKPEALKALTDLIADKPAYKDIAIMQGLTSDQFYVRMDSANTRDLLFTDIRDGLKDHLSTNPKKQPSRGLAADEGVFNNLTPAYMQRIIAAAEGNAPEEPKLMVAHQANIAELRRALVDMIPPTGLMNLNQRREGVQGFSKNMVGNLKTTFDTNAAGLANLSLASEIGRASKAMRDQIKALNADPSIDGKTLTAVTQAYNEVMSRAQTIKSYSTTSFMDAIRQMSHVVSVGLSPAYTMMLAAQIPTCSLPQLGKYHGFVESAGALARATSPTFDLVRLIAAGADRATFGLRDETIRGKLSDRATEDFHMEMARRGVYAQGFSEGQVGHDTDSVFGKVKQYSTMLGRYSEMVPRAQLALAARELYNKKAVSGFASAEDFAEYQVNQAQQNWNPSLAARQATRGGTFGVMTPIINQFMGYQIRFGAKLYREVHGALGGDKGSQRWLLAHSAAVTVLAGTLGLPMVAVAASVYDKLADWVTGSDNHDVVATYRSYLASTFGKEVGEVIARGAPRAAGVDFEGASEARILPGSSTALILTEKRKLEDMEKDWVKSMAGHSVGYAFNLAAAARDVSNHDFLDAGEKVLPELLKGGVEAYRLDQRGFVDRNGQKLPITASATDIMMKAIGLDPAKEAEYDEEQKTITGLNAMRLARSQNITRHLLLAQSRGDGQNFQDWERQATQFQLDHPGMQGPLQDFGRSLSQHLRAAATARGFGSPLGVRPNDISGRAMTSFGNLRDQ